jgi:adenylate cyclase
MTQEGFKRKLTAILSADVEGYSRLMGDDEEATVRTLTSYREVLTTLVQQHNGKVLDSPGDNLLAEFVSVVDAVHCGVAVQKEIKARNDELPESRKMQFRIGINLGDVIEEADRIYGDGVNIAARLEGLADPGGICISKTAFDHIESKLPYGYDFIGDQTVKNIAKPVGAYRILMDPRVTVSGKSVDKKPAAIRRTPILVGAVAVLVLAVGVGIWQFYLRPKIEPPSMEKKAFPFSGKPSIAVLPFVNMSDDPDQEYFSDGMTEEIITRLSMNPAVSVIARNSTFYYKGKRIKIQQIAQQLRARYVVEGSVRKAGNMVRITAQLIDATTESHLWAKTYDREFKDIFDLQDEIAQHIVAALNVKSREAEQARAWRVPTENLTAYDSLLRGLSHFFRFTEEENAKAKAMFERAIELDSEYASAYVCLGYTHFMSFVFGWNRDPRSLEQVSEFARRAISLDDSSPSAHALLADVYRTKGKFEQAISHAERALSLNPNDPSAYLSMGNALNSVGRSEKAVEAIKKAMSLNPHHTVYYNTDLARAYQNLGRYEEAIASLKAALARNPGWIPAYFDLAMNYYMAWGIAQNQDPLMLDRASEVAEKLVALDESSLYGYFALPIINLYKKQYEKALADAKKLIALAPENADGYALLAAIFISTGRSEEAIEMVEKAIQLNPVTPAWYLNTLATADALSGRETEAVATYKRVFDHNPSHADSFQAHVNLAMLYVGLGQKEDARTEAEEILKLVPNFSVEVWGQRNPNKDRAQIKRGMAALRKAGLKG